MLIRLNYYELISTDFLYSKNILLSDSLFWSTVQDTFLKFSHDFTVKRGFFDYESFLRDFKAEEHKENYTYCAFSRKSHDNKLFVFNCVDNIDNNKVYSSRYLVIEALRK